MGIIKLKNIKTFSYHGCLVEESKIGSDYRIDFKVKTNFKKSAATDNLKDTVDYVHLNTIVIEEMAIRANLLEQVAQRIVYRVWKELPKVLKIKVAVSKINPPIGGDVAAVSVEIKAKKKN